METKLIAAELATAAGVKTVITLGSQPSRISAIISAYSSSPFTAETAPVVLASPDISERHVPPHTIFLPLPLPLPSRRFWILHALTPRGSVFIDEGAFKGIGNGGRLLPAGVVKVEGTWAAGQAVRVVVIKGLKGKKRTEGSWSESEDGGTGTNTPALEASEPDLTSLAIDVEEETVVGDHLDSDEKCLEVGRGLANYNSVDVDRLKGRKSSEIEKLLGYIESEHVVESITIFGRGRGK